MELVMFLEQLVDLVVEVVTPAVLVLVTHLKLILLKEIMVVMDTTQDLELRKVVAVVEQLLLEQL